MGWDGLWLDDDPRRSAVGSNNNNTPSSLILHSCPTTAFLFSSADHMIILRYQVMKQCTGSEDH